MATNVHLLMTLQGGYTDATLAGETWQTGVRWYATNATPTAIGTLPTDIGPVSDTINRDETNWTISGNWYMSGPASSVLHVDDWLNDQVAPAAASLIASTRFPSMVELRAIRVYPIGNDGKAIPAPPYAAGSPVTLQWKAANAPNGGASTSR